MQKKPFSAPVEKLQLAKANTVAGVQSLASCT